MTDTELLLAISYKATSGLGDACAICGGVAYDPAGWTFSLGALSSLRFVPFCRVHDCDHLYGNSQSNFDPVYLYSLATHVREKRHQRKVLLSRINDAFDIHPQFRVFLP